MSSDDFGNDERAEQAFERELIVSAARDGISDESVRAAWSRFAVTLGATATLAGAATHGTLAGGVTAGRNALRWISLGALGGGVVTAALMTALGGRGVRTTDSARPASASTTATSSMHAVSSVGAAIESSTAAPGAAPNASRPQRVEPSIAERSSATEPVDAAATPKRHAASPERDATTRPPAPHVDPSSLAAEIALLDEARRAQSAGQYAHALAVLARYQREHPHGELRREGDVLRLETLSRSGAQEDAARLARRFLEAFPDDPHATHVRSFVK